MKNEIIISLKPQFAEMIENKEKTFEFRKYKPQNSINRLWIYVTKPVSMLKYIIETAEPAVFPEKIPENGTGNSEFNNGLKQSKFAFPIKHLYKLDNPISMKDLKEKFNIFPPQSFIYTDKYETLIDYVDNSCKLEKCY